MPSDYMERLIEQARARRNIDFLILQPYHMRYYLPNRDFAYNGVIFGDEITCSVIRLRDSYTMQRATFKFGKDDKWKDHVEMFQALADKKYPKPLRHKTQEHRDELFRSRSRDSRW